MRALLLCCTLTLTACSTAPANPQGWCPPVPAHLLEPASLQAERLPAAPSNADAIDRLTPYERWAHEGWERVRLIRAAQERCR